MRHLNRHLNEALERVRLANKPRQKEQQAHVLRDRLTPQSPSRISKETSKIDMS